MSKNTHLIIIRHGQIQANIDKLWHGWTDSALTDVGIQQAESVAARIAAEHPDINAIYASPLQRTFHTACKIGERLNLEVVTEPRIKEYGIGVFEGESFENLKLRHRFFDQIAADPGYAPENGESISQVGERVSAALADFVTKHPGEKIVAVSHGAAMALALAGLFHQDFYAWHNYQFQNTAVTEINLGPCPELLRLNCVAHLVDSGLDQLATVKHK